MPRRRRVVVIGSLPFRRMVADATPPDVELVASLDYAELSRLPGATWDETVVDAFGWAWLRRERPDLYARAPVVALPRPDGRTAALFLRTPFGRSAAAVKRAADVCLALAIALTSLPVLVLACAAIVVDTGRPVLFRHDRVGAGGRLFRFYKLRTMVVGAAERDERHREYMTAHIRGEASPKGGVYKLADDDRVTRVGAVLRRFSIDELPQVWNVLRGDMSIIGPRPMMPHEVDLLTVDQWARLRVRPGITGAWQVSGRSKLSFDEMMRLDIDYWQTWTPMSDMRVLLRTPLAILRFRHTA